MVLASNLANAECCNERNIVRRYCKGVSVNMASETKQLFVRTVSESISNSARVMPVAMMNISSIQKAFGMKPNVYLFKIMAEKQKLCCDIENVGKKIIFNGNKIFIPMIRH